MINIDNELFSQNINNLLDDSDFDFDVLSNTPLCNKDDDLISKIIKSYFEHIVLTNEELSILKYDNNFKVKLLNNIQERMKSIITDSSTLQFKEMVIVVNLLSYGKDYYIFKKYNEVSSDGISSILRDHESLLKKEELNSSTFELTFSYYVTLLDCLNELCIINLRDIVRKKEIKVIIELITESINLVKFNIKLNEKELEVLASFQGKLILSFSNISYIDTSLESIDNLIYRFDFIFNKQIDAYYLLTEEDNKTSVHYKMFLLNSTSLLLLMLRKLDSYEVNYFSKLGNIIELYNNYSISKITIFENLAEFKKNLLNNLVFLYDEKLELNYKDLYKIILQKQNLFHNDFLIMHELILADKELNKNDLIEILNRLLNTKKVKNDYYENYKLQIIDVILNNFIKLKIFSGLTEIIHSVVKYLDSSNTASHLISSFSKIHLTISLYYSYLGKDFLLISQKQYFISEKICSFTKIKIEYKEIYEEILFNNAKIYLSNLLKNNNFSRKELITFGYNLIDEYFEKENTEVKYKISCHISTTIASILKQKECSSEVFETEITYMISKQIFFGLCKCYIKKSSDDLSVYKELGFEILKQDLINNYVLVYKYSYSYNSSFLDIFNNNKEYIINNVNNLILSYLMQKKAKEYNTYLYEEDDDISFNSYL